MEYAVVFAARVIRRTPHGVRGLKCLYARAAVQTSMSHPARGAWIEMLFATGYGIYKDVAPRTGCVD